MSTSTDQKGSFFKGKTPRNAILGVGLVAAVVIGGLGIYYQAKEDAQTKADAAAKKGQQQQFSRKPDNGNQDFNSIINEQQSAADLKAQKAQRAQPTNASTPSADSFVDPQGNGARGNRAPTPGGDEDGIYSAGIFKGGGHQIQNKAGANGAGGLAGNGATLSGEGGVPTPQEMMAAQATAGRSVQDTLAAVQGQMTQGAQDRAGAGSAAGSQQSDLAFLRTAKLSSQSGAGFSTASFVGQEKSCTLAPPNHIPVLTMEKLNSDRPGTASLLVTEDVYDSVTGTCLVIPKGSKIVAPYSSDIRVGAESIMVAGTELRLPNGKEVPLNGAAGADQDGEAGFSGDVNNHFLKIFGASFATAILLGVFDKNSTVATTSSPYGVTQVGDTAGQVAAQTSQSILSRYQNIPPTITVKPGTRFMVKVNQDIHLEPYHE
ncbi:TrbI/VirB10 family protein [Paraburkholderia sp. RP-4-7]|jgi:type IV secretory pathway VirB10-like protein|uniref:TrbI/VirB10 family protein n=1 Tax=Paraburkholderia polaris TaxID=2728848 RepID=A0A848IQ74_9BURK|nr:TrbI/VirB10 family protein [Paraburkholderia polaris]NMM03146.1 TrbI/VirB10 family protein [Paraburkholderia polaris]